MKVIDLVEILKNCQQDLEVRVEFDDALNYWVDGVVEYPTGSSGYELEGEVVLSVSE